MGFELGLVCWDRDVEELVKGIFGGFDSANSAIGWDGVLVMRGVCAVDIGGVGGVAIC